VAGVIKAGEVLSLSAHCNGVMAKPIGAKIPDEVVEHLDYRANQCDVSRSAVIRAYLLYVGRQPNLVEDWKIEMQDQRDAVDLAKDE
jgi:hypothetical protein